MTFLNLYKLENHKNVKQYNLEALRGAAAIFVVFYHMILYKGYLDPAYSPTWIEPFKPSGHFCVLVFFVLSGYVIGVSNPNRLTRDKIIPYLRKRFIRIYPIYFVSLTVALIIGKPYSIKEICLNYSILQGAFGKIVEENAPIWSLNYEVLYYLLFIPLSYCDVRPHLAVLLSISLGVINYFLYPALNIPIISAYSYGFAFWATGWTMAKYLKSDVEHTNYSKLLSGIFLLLSEPILSTIYYISNRTISTLFHIDIAFPKNINWINAAVAFWDIASLPYCIFLIALFSNLKWRFSKFGIIFLQIIPFFTVIQIFKHFNGFTSVIDKLFPIGCFLISLILYHNRSTLIECLSEKLIIVGRKLGAISYGMYIIHLPILVLFSKISFFQGTGFTYVMRLLMYLSLSTIAAYFLEMKFQFWISKKLKGGEVSLSHSDKT